MAYTQILKNIEANILAFQSGSLKQNTLNLFSTLGYNSPHQMDIFENTPEGFLEYLSDNSRTINKNQACFEEWKNVDFCLQLTNEDSGLFESQANNFDGNINTYLLFCIELNNNHYPNRDLAGITRAMNRVFPKPVFVLFKHGSSLTLSIIDRRPHKKDSSKDVLEKITLIKDIDTQSPHRAHIEILNDLAFDSLRSKFSVTNFIELHNAWQKVLDTKELNKKFFQELSAWYFWAAKHFEFPSDTEKNREIRNATSVIRLITRLMFVWFLKEKGLVPQELFDRRSLSKILKNLDNGKSTFYKAILQNLFFATLNTEMGKRKFRSKSATNRDGNYFIHNVFRYEDYFYTPYETLKEYFENIPFLNGGLFECLDKEVEENGSINKVRIDGFSDRDDNPINLPNEFFFCEKELDIDLNDVYGTKNKKYKLRGIIDILNSYKFTITENTPIEEEIALDPELLGKVFENLLANYNPETQTTARKQTGSFYTPREIVNYMVDESLIAYLNQKLDEYDESEQKLRNLVSYSDEPHSFNSKEVETLINAIDNIKILDPACGSGAFPMGILQKLVHILHKLDPKNKLWKQRQIDKAELIDDAKARDAAIDAIEQAFENNELDYGRKLYLIENCIYGVDIQPIAAQISKLRFFISLIVEQKADVSPSPLERDGVRSNRGIRPLPNLETKFVAANTLISLDKAKKGETINMFENPEIEKIKEQLRKVRHSYFEARTPRTKEKYRNLDKELREKLAALLESEKYYEHKNAIKVAKWDPYDQNFSADFFEPEWMFGLKDGFDVVIGNPPYVQLQKDGGCLAKQFEKMNYQTFAKTGDIYALFYEKGINVLRNGGNLTFITSNKWMRAGYGEKLREFFTKYDSKILIDLGPGVFESATVDTNILLIKKNNNSNNLRAVTIKANSKGSIDINSILKNDGVIINKLSKDAWTISGDIEMRIKEKIERIGTPLKDWDIKINYGIKTGFNEAFIIDGKKKDELIAADPKNAEIIKPILRGRDIKRYKAEFADLWILFIPWHFPLHKDPTVNGASEKAERAFEKEYPAIYKHLLQFKKELSARNKAETGIRYEWYALQRCANTYYEEFEKEKIVYNDICQILTFSIVEPGMYFNNTAYFISNNKNNKHLASILNSKLINWYYRSISVQLGEKAFRMFSIYVENLPIPQISSEAQLPFIDLVDIILAKKERNEDTTAEEREIDMMVYKLYELTEEEIAIVEGRK